ncbi:MAG TPA: cytochrome c biogenesis protein CcsA [Bacteroidota bacterium]
MFGTVIIWVGFLAALLSAVSYYQATNGKSSSISLARKAFWVSVGSAVGASILLMLFILRHQFEYAYVWSYSSMSLPTHLLVTTFWAGQEGSFLFWTFCASLIGMFLLRYTRRHKIEFEVMAVYMLMLSFLFVLMISKSPFQYMWDVYPEQVTQGHPPTDGRGLNPLLQNFWMIAHPPVLFIGFASLAVPFAFAIAALWKRRYREWISSALPWVIFSALSLGAGLILGGYWAYGVLGWGGWWGWDPVENSSLIPWITVIILLHTLLVQRKTGKLTRTNFVLAIVSFLLVVYSTFLTRSGVLGDSSVHSFVDPGNLVYGLLVAWIVTMGGIGFGLLKERWKELGVLSVPVGNWTRESFLALGAIVMALSALVIFVGTSWPIISTATVEPSFYDKTNLPIAVLLSLLLGLSLFTRWGEEDRTSIVQRSALPLALAVGAGLILFYLGVQDWQMLAFGISSFFILATNIRLLVVLAMENVRIVGGPLAHLGLGVFFLGVIASGRYGEKMPAQLSLGKPATVLGYELTYLGEQSTMDGKSQFLINVRKNGASFMLAPVMFTSEYNNSVMRNPDYASSLTEDFYIEPVSNEQPDTHDHSHSTLELRKGEPQKIEGYTVTFEKFDMGAHGADGMTSGGGFAIGAVLVVEKDGKKESVVPVTVYANGQTPKPTEASLKDGTLGFQMVGMQVGSASNPSTIQVHITGLPMQNIPDIGHTEESTSTLIIEASVKPFMNGVWLGVGLMLLGMSMSFIRRIQEGRVPALENKKQKRHVKPGNGTSMPQEKIKQKEIRTEVMVG